MVKKAESRLEFWNEKGKASLALNQGQYTGHQGQFESFTVQKA